MMLKVSLHHFIIVIMTCIMEYMDLMDTQIHKFMLDNYETIMSYQKNNFY